MTKYKKLLALGLSTAMVLGMTACGGNEGGSSAPAAEEPAAQETPADENAAGGGRF